jgi:hypothetical protein
MTAVAKAVQAEYTEENPLVKLIETYLEYKIPDNWYKMTKWEKKEFIAAYDENAEGLSQRTSLCAYEIWEMVMDKKEPIDTYGLKAIKQAMQHFSDKWERVDYNVRFGTSYPRHKGSYALVVRLEDILV